MTTVAANKTGKMSLDEWVEALVDVRFPMLNVTAHNMNTLRHAEGMSIDRYCNSMLHDPGAVLTMLRSANTMPRGRLSSDVTTLESAAMLIGVDKVRLLHASMDILELPAVTPVEQSFMQVASRAFHAAYQAYDWAVQRADMVPKESFVAAFMHDMGEMAMALHGQKEMQEIAMLMEEEDMPADEAEYVVLGFSMEQLSYRLAKRWKMPELVTDSLSAERASNPRVYGVMLANQLAKFVEGGWYTPKVRNCIRHVADFLEISFADAVRRIHRNAVLAADESSWYGVTPAAAMLPLIPELELDENGELVVEATAGTGATHFCLLPQLDAYNDCFRKIQLTARKLDLNALMDLVMHAMHEGLGLNRVVYAIPEGLDAEHLKARYLAGTDNDPDFSQFEISLVPTNLFTHVMKKSQSIWLNADNRDKYWKLVPESFRELIGTDSFFAGSVFVEGKPAGLFYADRHITDCQLDEASYKRFKALLQLVGKAIESRRVCAAG